MSPHVFVLCARQRGGAVLALVGLLVLSALLAAAFTHRNLLFEHGSAANHFRAAQASEAADAGLDWALAHLNSQAPLDDDCRPGSAEQGALFAERFLAGPDAQGRWSVREQASTHRPLQASCTASGAGFDCRCAPDAGGGTDTETRQRFSVHFESSPASEQVHLLASGCSGTAADCAAGLGGTAVRAHARVTLARLPALTTPPAAALTLRGALSLPDAPFELSHRTPASGGLTLRSGGAIDAPRLSLHSVPGAPAWASVVDHDAFLSRIDAAAFFDSLFRMSASQWQQQPDVRHVACATACDEALVRALADGTHPRLWLRGGLHLASPQTLGSARAPVLLVVDGPVRFDAAVRIHGLVHGRAETWTDHAGAQVHGAVTLETDLAGRGASRIVHDAAILSRLRTRSGTWARVPGSWRDFE
jgi:hypothetical protein